MNQPPARAVPSPIPLVLLLVLTVALFVIVVGAIPNLQPVGPASPGGPIPAPGAGLDL
jgi:hypothetical protein